MPTTSRRFLVAALTAAAAASLAPPALAGPLGHHAQTALTTATAVTATAPVRVVSAPGQLADVTGAVWQPDSSVARGGSLTSTTQPIARTGSDNLYQHARVGVTDYAIPVSTPGTYFVDLFTSETGGAQPGQRVWNVTAEGRPVATAVDVARDAGPATAWHVLFAVPVTDGTLDIHLTAVAGKPAIDAVEADFEKPATSVAPLFDDEFDGAAGTSPDATKWGFASGGGGWGNNELETYTSRPSNASLDGLGDLDITARQETYTGTDGITRDYTSARLTTTKTFSFQYGTATARMRIPGGQGLWPAFWALGSNAASVGWPACGEMDVMENIGKEPTVAHATVHAALAATPGAEWASGRAMTLATPLSSDYHTYGLVWGPNAMSISLDGQTYFSLSASDMAPTSVWDFNHPFYLLLNLAVGGSWPGSPDATTAFPAVLSVDYVRVTG